MSEYYSTHLTPLGTMEATWTNGGLLGLRWGLPNPETRFKSTSGSPQSAMTEGEVPRGWRLSFERFDQSLLRYFSGDSHAFSDIPVAQEGWTPFFHAVYLECLRIPFGETRTYQELAERCGSPKAARAVGQAMARNRIPLVIPCHRVLGARGGMGGYSGPGALETKRWLLDHERRSIRPAALDH